MLITKVHIEKFRGFHDQEFEVGSMLTAIAGQNGTQKSTLLGMITQTFIIENVQFKQDTSSTVKVVGYHNGEKVLVNNCHLGIPPFYDMRSPCLFGN